MKRLVALIFTFIPIVAVVFYQRAEIVRVPASHSIKQVIFDLDGTLVESIGFNAQGDVVLENGEAYRIFPHAKELVEKAWQNGLEIHFFSGGPKIRNDELLQKIRLHDGRSFAQLASSVHSKEDLTDLGADIEGQYFTDRYRKDLSKVGNIEELIIFEDNKFFPLDEVQRSRVLELPIHRGGPLNSWYKEQRLAWASVALDEIIAGKEPSEINKGRTAQKIIQGISQFGGNAKKDLSRHGCAGIFMSLAID